MGEMFFVQKKPKTFGRFFVVDRKYLLIGFFFIEMFDDFFDQKYFSIEKYVWSKKIHRKFRWKKSIKNIFDQPKISTNFFLTKMFGFFFRRKFFDQFFFEYSNNSLKSNTHLTRTLMPFSNLRKIHLSRTLFVQFQIYIFDVKVSIFVMK